MKKCLSDSKREDEYQLFDTTKDEYVKIVNEMIKKSVKNKQNSLVNLHRTFFGRENSDNNLFHHRKMKRFSTLLKKNLSQMNFNKTSSKMNTLLQTEGKNKTKPTLISKKPEKPKLYKSPNSRSPLRKSPKNKSPKNVTFEKSDSRQDNNSLNNSVFKNNILKKNKRTSTNIINPSKINLKLFTIKDHKRNKSCEEEKEKNITTKSHLLEKIRKNDIRSKILQNKGVNLNNIKTPKKNILLLNQSSNKESPSPILPHNNSEKFLHPRRVSMPKKTQFQKIIHDATFGRKRHIDLCNLCTLELPPGKIIVKKRENEEKDNQSKEKEKEIKPYRIRRASSIMRRKVESQPHKKFPQLKSRREIIQEIMDIMSEGKFYGEELNTYLDDIKDVQKMMLDNVRNKNTFDKDLQPPFQKFYENNKRTGSY
ncbi:MAG: coiled-coil domain-containing protein 22 [archaeon]|nr:coiled-coil domain-containing protein 22 [archaeon]